MLTKSRLEQDEKKKLDSYLIQFAFIEIMNFTKLQISFFFTKSCQLISFFRK